MKLFKTNDIKIVSVGQVAIWMCYFIKTCLYI